MNRRTTAIALALAIGIGIGCGGDDAGGSAGDGSGTAGTGPAGPTGGDDSGATSSPGDTSDDDPTGPDPTTGAPPSVCGNGVMEDLEECDDGNEVSGDGCDIDCTITLDTSLWQVTTGGAAMIRDVGHGIAVDGTGSIVVVGYVSDAVADPDVWVGKYDPSGMELWAIQLDVSSGDEDRGYAVAIDADDDIYLTGESDITPTVADIWVGQVLADGTPGWSTTYDGPAADDDGGRGIAVDAAGNVYVTGFVNVGTTDNEIFIGRWAPGGGAPQWTRTVSGPAGLDDRGQGIAVDSVGDVVVGGYVANAAFDRNVWLSKYDPDGTAQWTQTWDSPNGLDDAGMAIAIAPDDSIGITGSTPVIVTNEDAWLGKYAADGTLVWFKQFGAPSYLDDNGLGLTADAAGNLVVAGFKSITATDTDIWLRKYDAGGNVVWTQGLAGAGGSFDEARAIATDPDGNYVVTGEIRADNTNDGDIWIAKFAPR